jgi:ribosome maturation factor RimP
MASIKAEEKLEKEVAEIAQEAGCELLRLSFKRDVLQILLDRPEGGVTLDHCQLVSKQVSALLDVLDFGKDRYVLEVSSPGLDRELFRPQDFIRFQGSRVRVTFFEGGERAAKQTIVGRLTSYDPELTGGSIVVDATESKQSFTIALRDVQKARLEVEL